MQTYKEKIPEEAISFLNNWKSDVSLSQLVNVLNTKSLLAPAPYEQCLKWFLPDDNGNVGRNSIAKIIKKLVKYRHKEDVDNILKEFDLDGDGVLGLDDVKKMGLLFLNGTAESNFYKNQD